ncbi:MAG: hypothetical protein U9Q82_04835 [Chloroflexota bacterium]|nr:hypothetical protein [Chloroflexota bacterium]
MAKVDKTDYLAKTEKENPVKARGVGLRESEWKEIEQIAGELNTTPHGLAVYAIRDFVKKYKAGDIETQKTQTLPGL